MSFPTKPDKKKVKYSATFIFILSSSSPFECVVPSSVGWGRNYRYSARCGQRWEGEEEFKSLEKNEVLSSNFFAAVKPVPHL